MLLWVKTNLENQVCKDAHIDTHIYIYNYIYTSIKASLQGSGESILQDTFTANDWMWHLAGLLKGSPSTEISESVACSPLHICCQKNICMWKMSSHLIFCIDYGFVFWSFKRDQTLTVWSTAQKKLITSQESLVWPSQIPPGKRTCRHGKVINFPVVSSINIVEFPALKLSSINVSTIQLGKLLYWETFGMVLSRRSMALVYGYYNHCFAYIDGWFYGRFIGKQ